MAGKNLHGFHFDPEDPLKENGKSDSTWRDSPPTKVSFEDLTQKPDSNRVVRHLPEKRLKRIKKYRLSDHFAPKSISLKGLLIIVGIIFPAVFLWINRAEFMEFLYELIQLVLVILFLIFIFRLMIFGRPK